MSTDLLNSDLQARIERLEDLEAIKHLKALYCEICDDDHNPDRIVQIFTEDCVWEGAGIGRAEGHSGLRTLFEGFQKAMSFSQHMAMNPRIELDGSTARATWDFLGPFTFRVPDSPSGKTRWQVARYVEEYAKVDGAWKIHRLNVSGRVVRERG